MNRFYKKINVWFTLPAVALFIIVVLIPFFMGLVYSFTSWRGAYFAGGSLSESFIGLDNYKKVFTNTKFLASLIYTVKYGSGCPDHKHGCVGTCSSDKSYFKGSRCFQNDIFSSQFIGRTGTWIYLEIYF